MDIWTQICENRLLSSVQFIVLLNKLDILKKKLKSGIKFSDYVSNYKDQPNDAKSVTKCVSLRCHFVDQE